MLPSGERVKIHNEQFTFQSQKVSEAFNITTQVKAALEKSKFREGIVVVSSLHSNSAVIVSDGASGVLNEIGDTNFTPRLLGLLLQHQVVIPFSEARLDLAAGEVVLFLELDGIRPRRIIVKVIGE